MRKLLCRRVYKVINDDASIIVEVFMPELNDGAWRCFYTFYYGDSDEYNHSIAMGDIIDAISSVNEVISIKINNRESEFSSKICLMESDGFI